MGDVLLAPPIPAKLPEHMQTHPRQDGKIIRMNIPTSLKCLSIISGQSQTYYIKLKLNKWPRNCANTMGKSQKEEK